MGLLTEIRKYQIEQSEASLAAVSASFLTAWAEGMSDSEVEVIQLAVVDWPDSRWTAWVERRDRIKARYPGLSKHVLDYSAFALLTSSEPFTGAKKAEA